MICSYSSPFFYYIIQISINDLVRRCHLGKIWFHCWKSITNKACYKMNTYGNLEIIFLIQQLFIESLFRYVVILMLISHVLKHNVWLANIFCVNIILTLNTRSTVILMHSHKITSLYLFLIPFHWYYIVLKVHFQYIHICFIELSAVLFKVEFYGY